MLRRAPRLARQKAFVVFAPAAALYAYLVLRGNLPLEDALGFPMLFLRYTLPALPMLVVVASIVVHAAAPRWIEATAGAAFAVAIASYLALGPGHDDVGARQIVLLALPLVAALGACVVVVVRRRELHAPVVRWAVAIVCSIGFGLGLGHDLDASLAIKRFMSHRLSAVSASLPERFAVVGDLREIDPVLALRAERDVEYADAWEVSDPAAMRAVLDRWVAEDRPVFLLAGLDGPQTSPLTGVVFEVVDPAERLYRVRDATP